MVQGQATTPETTPEKLVPSHEKRFVTEIAIGNGVLERLKSDDEGSSKSESD